MGLLQAYFVCVVKPFHFQTSPLKHGSGANSPLSFRDLFDIEACILKVSSFRFAKPYKIKIVYNV